jgi:type IV pilus assembly protein PilO
MLTQTRKWILLTAVAVVAALALGWFLLIAPKRAEATDLRQQREEQAAANAQLRTRIEQLKILASDLPRQQARLQAVERKLPASPEMPTLVRSLVSAAASSKVSLVSMTPTPPTFLDAAAAGGAPAATGAAARATTGPRLAQVPIAIVVAGDYYEVEQFLNKVETFQRAVLVTGLDIGAPQAGESTNGDVSVTIAARAFMVANSASASAAPVLPAPAN